MSKKIRDYLFLVFIGLFVFLTVIFSLYASGYKFNLSWPLKLNKFLQKTGMLIVSTTPSGATIYLNDKPLSTSSFSLWRKNYLTSDAKIKNLLPGDYTLSLERSGYWPFEKKIRIDSGQTTFVENINLFRFNEPSLVTLTIPGELKISPNNRYLYLAQTKEIWNLKSQSVKTLPLETVTAGQWLSNDKLLAGGYIFNPEKTADLDYTKIIGAEASHWFYEEATGRLYYQNKNSLNRLEADSRTNTLLINGENFLTYEPRSDHLFLVVSKENRTILQDYNIKTQKVDSERELPNVGLYQFVPDKQKFLSLYDSKNKTLYLFNPSDLKNSNETIKNIISWQWPSPEQLIYNNAWEIYSFDVRQNRAALITRVSEEITKIIWHQGSEYLIFSTAKSLNIVDLKNGTITTIFRAAKIADLALDEKNDLLYFWADINNQKGIYKILLQ
jgi:hypothetical protein